MGKRTTLVAACLASVGIAVACDDLQNPTRQSDIEAPRWAVVPGADRVADVPAVSFEVRATALEFETSVSALEKALSEGDWHAMVAFKAPTSERAGSNLSRQTTRAAVPKGIIEEGLSLLDSLGIEMVRYNALIGAAHVIFRPGEASELFGHPLVDYIEPQYVVAIPGGSAFIPAPAGEEPPQEVPIGVELVRADLVWNQANGSGETMGYIDDGYMRGHEDLYSVSDSRCENWTAGACDDGWHGTFVAGVMAGQNNSLGVKGVAYGIANGLYWCKGGTNTLIAECLDWLDDRVKIINMSFSIGSSPVTSVGNAVAAAYDNSGKLLVSIANNRDSTATAPGNVYPAEYSQVIGVSGVMPDSTFANGPAGLCVSDPSNGVFIEWGNASNHGDYVELAGPFYTRSTAVTSGSQSFKYGYVCGTSFAAPHVAAVAALIWDLNPTFTNADLRTYLQNTAKDLGSAGRDDYYGYGLVDAYTGVNPPAPPSVTIDGPTEVPTNAGEMCSWSASVSGGTGGVTYEWKWNGQVVSTDDFYVSNESNEGTYWLQVRVEDTLFQTDTDGFWVDVDDAYSCF